MKYYHKVFPSSKPVSWFCAFNNFLFDNFFKVFLCFLLTFLLLLILFTTSIVHCLFTSSSNLSNQLFCFPANCLLGHTSDLQLS
ncbi:hypothetical protein CW304_17535 [Bacillus sp. UFRGS-B20]|nr:hypothetical protein CW304_17535 [Bacillus sp. UFRGS-B20]